jgi:dynein heavy chain
MATSSWQYLESIFNGQPEIHRQLANEVAKFRTQDKIFNKEMSRVAEQKNAFRALVEKAPDFAKTLEDMNGNFGTIKKDLFTYLDAKRGKFPRFYFLPYEDLLAIIGMGKDPRPLN